MLLRALLLILAAVLAPAVARAQAAEGTPQWVVERWYGRDEWAQRGEYLAGELEQFRTGATPGTDLPPNARVTLRTLRADARGAVVAVTVVHPEMGGNAYVFLRRSERWQIVAYRALALPPLFYTLVDTLEAMPRRPPQYERMLRNMRLTIASDSALKAYFAEHRPGFEALAQAADTVTQLSAEPWEDEGALSPALLRVRKQLQELDLGAVTRDERAAGCVLLEIGGMIDNSVGYLYATAGCQVPEMDAGSYIYVEQIAPGWYLYKTT